MRPSLLLLTLIPSAACLKPYLAAHDVAHGIARRVGGKRSWQEAIALADRFVAQLNLTEKAAMVTGNTGGHCDGNINAIPRLGFSGLCLHDGPAAIRTADLASVFPSGVTAGATWDRELLYARGFALGEEFRDKGSHVLLGPVAGPLGRHPLGGRFWEGFAADPYLSGVAMEYTIRGHQDAGVQACAKHYIGNEQETHRSNVVVNGTDVMAISSNIDDRVLRELYLWPFSDAVRAGTASVMCSYNRLNQTYACENDQLLNKILKDELGFRGYVVSDFFATHSGVQSIEAGLDMTMPGPVNQQAALLASTGGIPFEEVPSYFGQNITSAVTGGLLNETRLDDMIRRVMTPYYHLRQDEDFPDVDPSTLFVVAVAYGQPVTSLPGTIPPARDVRRDHAAVIRNVASAGTVLLKNQDDILPIRNITNVAVFGNAATDVTEGLNFMGYDYTNPDQPVGSQYGPLLVGGGSGSGRAVSVISPLQAIRERSAKDGFRLQYVTNNDLIASGDFRGIFPAPEICLVFLKTFSTENWDRLSFENDWNSTLVVENAARICPNSTVVITHSSGVNTLPWNNKVAAILAAHYPGEQSGNSIVDVLWGDVNPSGHLPYTIPKNESDYEFPILNITGPEALNSNAWQTNFTEGLYIDYRHFDAHDITPLYPFGHGLSYTTFSMAKTITVQKKTRNPSPLPPAGQVSPGGNPHLWDTILTITVCLSNDGSVRGAAVPQLYVSIPTGGNGNAPDRTPVKVLRGFEKVDLGPGKSAKITFQLTRRDLSFWSVDEQEWRLPRGAVAVHVGFSAGDIRVSKDVQLM